MKSAVALLLTLLASTTAWAATEPATLVCAVSGIDEPIVRKVDRESTEPVAPIVVTAGRFEVQLEVTRGPEISRASLTDTTTGAKAQTAEKPGKSVWLELEQGSERTILFCVADWDNSAVTP